MQNTFAKFKQLSTCFRYERFWETFFRGSAFETSLALMQMVQRALQCRDCEGVVRETRTSCDAVQSTGQLGPRDLKLADKVLQVLVDPSFQSQIFHPVPKLYC